MIKRRNKAKYFVVLSLVMSMFASTVSAREIEIDEILVDDGAYVEIENDDCNEVAIADEIQTEVIDEAADEVTESFEDNGILESEDGAVAKEMWGAFEVTYDDVTCTLTITGTGNLDVPNYHYNYPWFKYRATVENVIFSEGITSVPIYAFCDWNNDGYFAIKSVTLPSTITEIGEHAFTNCRSLETIQFPNKLRVIGNAAFYGCAKLDGLDFPSKVTTIGKSAFEGCTNNKSIVFHDGGSVKIWDDAFKNNTSVTRVSLGETMEGKKASVTEIGTAAFYNNALVEKVDIPDTVTAIGWYAFAKCSSLRECNLREGLIEIWWDAFAEDPCLEKLVLPKTLTTAKQWFHNSEDTAIYCYKNSVGYDYCKSFGMKNCFVEGSTYTVKYDGNGATSGRMKDGKAYILKNLKFKTYTLSTNKYKRKGYTFNGWKLDSTKFANKAKVTKPLTTIEDGTVTMVAQWKPNNYTIKYNLNGGIAKKIKSTSCKYGKKYKITSTVPVRRGYTFLGWSTDKNGRGKIYKSKASVKNLTSTNGKTVTLYAVWLRK